MTSTGEGILELFALDARVIVPDARLANGREEIGDTFGAVERCIRPVRGNRIPDRRRSRGSARIESRPG